MQKVWLEETQIVKQLLWLYIFLVIFEGVLRKWLLPSLATPLLLVRDPIALLCIYKSWGLLVKPPWLNWIRILYGISLFAIIIAITIGHGNILVALYGARILLIHFPLIFIFGIVFKQEDVTRVCRQLLIIVIPMTALIVAQYSLPQTHILNVAPGGEGSAGFSGVGDKFRPPGTFSFINGVSMFYTYCASAFLALAYTSKAKKISILLFTSVLACLIIAVPFSISRSLLFGYGLVLVFTILSLVLSRIKASSLVISFFIISLITTSLSSISAMEEPMRVFSTRWEQATKSEGQDKGVNGVLEKRVLANFSQALFGNDHIDMFGKGIGISSNVGAQALTNRRSFLIAEDSWSAIFGELGLILGAIFISLRIGLSLSLLFLCIKAADRMNPMPMILLGSSIYPLLSGNLNQPTALGFTVVGAGLTLAACRK